MKHLSNNGEKLSFHLKKCKCNHPVNYHFLFRTIPGTRPKEDHSQGSHVCSVHTHVDSLTSGK